VLAAAGLPTGIAIGMLTLLSTMPQYLLGWAGGVEDAGRFAVLLYTVVAVEVLLHGLAQSWIPSARTLLERGALTTAAVGRTALRWTLVTGVPGLLGLGAAALVLPVALGPEFAVTGAYALPLAVAMLLVPASFAADTALVVRNRYTLSMAVSVTALVVGTTTGAVLVGLGGFTLPAALWTFAVTMAVRALAGFAAVLADGGSVLVGTSRRLVGRCWPAVPIAVAVIAIIAAGPRWALGVTGAVLLVLVLSVLRVSLAVLLVMTVPLAFYVEPGGLLVNLAVSDVLLLLLLVRVLLNPTVAEAAGQVSGPVRAALASFALFLAVACGTVVIRSGLGGQADWTALLVDAVKLVVVLGYFCVCAIVFRDRLLHRDHRFLTAWAFTAAVVGALGVVGALLFERGIETGLTMDFRATGTFEDPNAFATYLILSLPLVLLARHLTGRSLLSWHLVPIIAGIIASFSRGALVGVACVLVLLCLLAFRDPALRALRIVAVLGVGATAVLVLDGAASTVFQGSRGVGFGEDVRFRLWEAAVDVFLHAPVTGVGLGQFIVSSRELLGSAGGVLAHNTYLSVLAEGGLLGSALLLTVPVVAVIGLVRRGDTAAHLLLASGAGVAAMAVSLNLQNFRPIWMLLALALAWTATVRAEDADGRPSGPDSVIADLEPPARPRRRAPRPAPSPLEESWN
jgi:O-antigen ligase